MKTMCRKTTKILSNYALLLLITAFLTMQWSSTHVHLPEQHSHHGSQHQHLANLHSHSLIDEVNASHVSHEVSHANVITFDLECSFQKQQKTNNLPVALISEAPQLVTSLWLISYKFPVPLDHPLSYFRYSTNHPRAPPQTS